MSDNEVDIIEEEFENLVYDLMIMMIFLKMKIIPKIQMMKQKFNKKKILKLH